MHLIHRGILNKKFKENCLDSFKASFKKKYGIETDIHVTKDKKFVCFHDFTLKRIFKINKSIKDIKYQELKKIKYKSFKIPLLAEVLKLSKNKYPIFIEIKPFLEKRLLSKLINETKGFNKVVFISFNKDNIDNLLKINSSIKVGDPTQFLKYLSLSFIKFLSFLNFANNVSRSSTGFFKVSGIKFPPNLSPQKPFLLC